MVKYGCAAYQTSDQMICHKCELVWDMSDPDPPECVSARITPKQNPLTEAFDSIIKDNDPHGKKATDTPGKTASISTHFGKFGHNVSDLSADRLLDTLELAEGFHEYHGHAVTVVTEKLSPITVERMVSIFKHTGEPVTQIRKTSRASSAHVETRKYLDYKKEWTTWSAF